MKLTTVLASVNLNSEYYLFIPKQIKFWKFFNINFVAIIVGEKIPSELLEYSKNIILWNKNLNLNSSFVAQNLRIYYPSLLNLPDDELCMITDMDMLPTNDKFYKEGLENFKIDDFIYYRNIAGNQIYMCYNAAHPNTWAKAFNIYSEDDIEKIINKTYDNKYNGSPGSSGWFIDQLVMYKYLINYPHLKVLNRPIKRMETWTQISHMNNNDTNFIKNYDDAHFHRSFSKNKKLIEYIETEFNLI